MAKLWRVVPKTFQFRIIECIIHDYSSNMLSQMK